MSAPLIPNPAYPPCPCCGAATCFPEPGLCTRCASDVVLAYADAAGEIVEAFLAKKEAAA